jgi:iron(III) transport system permease protein
LDGRELERRQVEVARHVRALRQAEAAVLSAFRRQGPFGLVALVAGGGFLLLSFYPYAQLLVTSLRKDGRFTLAHYAGVLGHDYLLRTPLLHSLGVSVASAALATALGTLLAWFAVRSDLLGRRAIAAFVAVPHIVPSFQLASSWIVVFGDAGIVQSTTGLQPVASYGLGPLVAVQTVHLTLLAFLNVAGALGSLDPSLEEAARACGLGRGQVLRRVTLPLMLPAILSGLLLTFAYSMAEFGAPILLAAPAGFGTLTTQIYELSTAPPLQFGEAAVLSLLLGAIALATMLVNLRLLARGSYVTLTGKSSSGEPARLGVLRGPLSLLAWGWLAATAIVPLAALVLISLLESWGRGFGPGNLTLAHYATMLASHTLNHALWNSVGLALGAAALATVIGFVAAYGAVRLGTRWGALLDRMSFINFATPSLVIGIAFLLAFSGPPVNLFGTYWILLFAYFVHYSGLCVRGVDAHLRQLSVELEEAGAACGLRPSRILARITLPLLRHSLAAGFLLVFVNTIREISATSLLASQGTETLAYEAFLRYADGDYTVGSAYSVVMVAIALTGSAMIARRTRLAGAGFPS